MRSRAQRQHLHDPHEWGPVPEGLSTRRQFVRCQDTSLARYLPGQHGSLGLPLQDWQDT